jgi:hypothetical protein
VSRPCPTLPAQAETHRDCVACGPYRKPTGQAWRKAQAVVYSLHLLRRGRAACHHADRRRALSAFNASCPIRRQAASGSPSRRRTCPVCWQTVRPCQVAHSTRRPSTRSFPCMLRVRGSRASGHKKITPTANVGGSKRYILYVPGPTCWGPAPLCMPPFKYKRGGMRRYKGSNLRHSQVHRSSQSIHHTVE